MYSIVMSFILSKQCKDGEMLPSLSTGEEQADESGNMGVINVGFHGVLFWVGDRVDSREEWHQEAGQKSSHKVCEEVVREDSLY